MDLFKWKKYFLHNSQYKIIRKYNTSKQCRITYDCIVNNNSWVEGNNKISSCTINDSKIGFGTYIGSGYLPNCLIGRFCSISYNVNVEPSTHSMSYVSTYPGFYSSEYFPFNSSDYNPYILTENGYYCEIGNDVWIGKNVLIKGGVIIGNGAIIGMGAVVTHNVPDYSIVAGVPAKVIKYRFSQDDIEKLNKILWWNWNPDDISKRKNEFLNPISFLEKYSKTSFQHI